VGKLRSLQILRFVAAAMVVLDHTARTSLGAAGVDVFFVLSGYVICLVAQGRTAGGFLRDRLTRIFPIYYVCTLPWVVLVLAYGRPDLDAPQSIAATLTLWPVYDHIFGPLLAAGWSLCFEVLFYAGMAAVLVWRRLAWLLPAAYGLSVIAAYATGLPMFRFIGNPLIAEFGLGVALSMIRFKSRPAGAAALVVAVAALLLAAPLFADKFTVPGSVWDLRSPERPLVWGLPAALAVWGALQFDPLTSRVSAWLSYLGDASYSIYLTHLFTVVALAPILPWPLTFLAAIVVGVAVHEHIEKRLMAFFRKRWRARDTAGGRTLTQAA
jgi:exopolysaccharide production protein ExoZ